jgi:hypothetical protein
MSFGWERVYAAVQSKTSEDVAADRAIQAA